MDDGLDEDAQVFTGLTRFVAFKADTQASRARVIQRHLEHQLLLPFLRQNSTYRFLFLGEKDGERDG